MNTLPDGLYVRAGSHRARNSLEGRLGRKLRAFWSFYEDHVYLIRPDEWPLVQSIRGVTRARIKQPEKMGECWYQDDKDERYSRGTP